MSNPSTAYQRLTRSSMSEPTIWFNLRTQHEIEGLFEQHMPSRPAHAAPEQDLTLIRELFSDLIQHIQIADQVIYHRLVLLDEASRILVDVQRPGLAVDDADLPTPSPRRQSNRDPTAYDQHPRQSSLRVCFHSLRISARPCRADRRLAAFEPAL